MLVITAALVRAAVAQAPKDTPAPADDPNSALEFLGSYSAPSAVLATETSHASAHPPSPSADRRLRQLGGGAGVLPPWPEDFAWRPQSIEAACGTGTPQLLKADQALRSERFRDASADYGIILKQGVACPVVAWNRALAEAYAGAPRAIGGLATAAPGAPSPAAADLVIGLEKLASGGADSARPRAALPSRENSAGGLRERDILWAEAMQARFASDPAQVRQILTHLSSLEPGSAAVWFALGTGALEEARATSRRLTELAPDSPWSRRLEAEALAARYPLLARKLWSGNQGTDHSTVDENSAVAEPDSPERLYAQARAALDTAETAFEHASRSPRFSAELHALRALADEQQDDEGAALREYRAGLAEDPGSAVLHAGLGHLYREHSEFEKARPELAEALRLNPSAPPVAFELGDVYQRLGDPKQALGLLNRALELDPTLLVARWSRAKAHLALGNTELALADLEASAPADSTGELQWQLARLYRRLGRTELAALAEQRSIEQRKAQVKTPKAESVKP